MTMIQEDGGVPHKCAIWSQRKKEATGAPYVLIVDDYADAANAVCMLLSLYGFDADAVYGGHVALEAATRERPQIVILDIWMPDMSGLEVAARLRSGADTSEMILIAHSAASSDADVERARQAGFDAFCAKPTDGAALVPLLRYFVPDPGAKP
jgi:DNA-binding response OmpR family regulator